MTPNVNGQVVYQKLSLTAAIEVKVNPSLQFHVQPTSSSTSERRERVWKSDERERESEKSSLLTHHTLMDILPNTHHYHTSVCVHPSILLVPVVPVLPRPSQTQRGNVGEEIAP